MNHQQHFKIGMLSKFKRYHHFSLRSEGIVRSDFYCSAHKGQEQLKK